MRYGFTTGSCAAAVSKAAVYMLLSGKVKEEITIETPKGISYTAQIVDIHRSESEVSCAVKKDGGDDPDITTGTLIYTKVSYLKSNIENDNVQIVIEGGIGVGRVTKPGLDQPVGNAAINRVPREMITKEVSEVCKLLDYEGKIYVEISVPRGEEIAKQTFNPRLGIVGGISILGTSGIVEPMSNQAILDTIRVELNQRRAFGFHTVAMSPGNYGLDFMKKAYGYDLDKSVKCSNFIGNSIDMAVELGFEKLLLTGHIGKLIKVSGGIMNTHSKEGDCRMELLTSFAIKEQVPLNVLQKMLECVTTEEAVRILREEDKDKAVLNASMENIHYFLNKRGKGKIQIECIMYSKEFGELARSKGAVELLQELLE